ncbi:MAG TPA: AbrB/MazE/SpoVT family DNA-binding domain-containing protein [Candidatus Bathyarchaeia archaeon]
MLTRSRLRRWGNSLGVTVPKELVRREGLREGEEVEVQVRRVSDIRALRGRFPIKELQKAKEEMRKGWGE